MSGWDWLHAGLEVATYAKARSAQRQLSEMTTAAEVETARRVMLEAMKSFIFDISRDIQLAEEQLAEYPQQVYIVARALDWRLADSGLSAEVFPDFQDKEYVFQTQKKIAKVTEESRASLAQEQIEQSDTAVRYIAEIPILQKAISAKSALESIRATEEQWQGMKGHQGKRKRRIGLALAGLALTACVGAPMLVSGLGMLTTGDWDAMFGGVMMIIVGGGIPIGSIALLALSGKSNPEFKLLQTSREEWRKQLMKQEEWQEVVSAFGDLSSEEFGRIYEERLAFLTPLLGADFQKYLASGA